MNDYFNWLDADDETFIERLRQHVVTGSTQWAPLLEQERVSRTWMALMVLKQRIELTMSDMNADRAARQQACLRKGHFGKSEWFEYEAEWKVRRSTVNREKSLYEGGMQLVKPALREARIAQNPSNTDAGGDTATMRNLVEGLTRAITDHKVAMDFAGNEPTFSDRALWSSLARLHMPTRSGELSLREWLARIDA